LFLTVLDAEEFEPKTDVLAKTAKATDKWEGEDEDDDVKVRDRFEHAVFDGQG